MGLWLPEDELLLHDSTVLKDTLERYRRVLGGSGYAFWEWGLHDNSYRCGGSFWSKLGYLTVDEAVTCVENVQEYVHPDDFKIVSEVVLSHLRFDTPIDMVYRIKAKDGTYWWTQACASSTRDENGRVTYLSGVNFDLSHLRETEKALRLSEARHERILAASNDGIWEWSLDGSEYGRFHTSHSCWKHLGYTEEEVDALPEDERLAIWRSYVHPDDLVRMQRALRRHFVQKTPFDIEYRMFGHQGEMFWLRSRGQAIFDGQGRAILMSGINIDITEVKAAEERVRVAKESAENANNAKSNFLSSMSHELRTPLNAIMGFSQLAMSDATLNEGHQAQAQQVYQAGDHLLRLVNDVLDLAQIEAGKISLLIEPVLPARLVEECFVLVTPLATEREIELSFTANDCEHDYILADAVRLKQCLLNLINNAVKYNQDRGRVEVAFEHCPEGLQIAISDTGQGISTDQQKELFQPFNRLGAEHSAVEGSGIGLVITKELVESMQGLLTYDEGRAVGACFSLRLPLAEMMNQETPLETNMLSHHALNNALSFSQSQSILYIEDNQQNIQVLESMLSALPQIHLSCQLDPFLGLYHARSQHVDLIILDINLPEISGLDLVKIIKADDALKHIPVIALSANAMPYDVKKGKEAGFDEYLTKPVKLPQLFTVLNQYLSKKAA